MTKVSVIIPVYNGEGTIKRCLLSVLSQTLTDIEVIIINDGSTDGTLSVLNEITDSRLKIITTPNGGQGFARNRGIEEASGECISFVDADDTIENTMLETLYTTAEKENADVAQCNLLDIYPSGGKRIQLTPLDKTVTITNKGEYTDKYLTPCLHSYEVCNKLIKRSAIGDLRFKDTRKYFSEDLLFNLELISRINCITFVDKPLYNYYQSDESHLHNNYEKRLNGLQLLFHDYISSADSEMKSAAAYTAAMILTYSAGECEKSATEKMLKSAEFQGYVKTALTRDCTKKHRLLLTAMRYAPIKIQLKIVKWYGGRWQ